MVSVRMFLATSGMTGFTNIVATSLAATGLYGL